MRKQEMIDLILEEEKYLWTELKSSIDEFGYDSVTANSIRNQWYAIDRLIHKLELNKQ